MALMKKYHKIFKIFKMIYFTITIFIVGLILVDFIVYFQTHNFIKKSVEISSADVKKRYVIVLGASVRGEKLSHVLQDRMDAAIELYHKGLVDDLLLSGDGMGKNYNEPLAMKKFALKHGIPMNVIFIDDRGFNTYTSILNAKNAYHIKDAYIISQSFHVGRALWIARGMGIDAIGVSVGKIKVFNYDTLREIFARAKDFFKILIYRSTN